MEQILGVLESHKILIEFFTSLVPIVLTVFGLYIAIQQYRTNRKKIKNDLFEKRYTVFVAISDFIMAIAKGGKVTYEERIEFLSRTRGAEFLFDRKIKKYIDEVWEKSVDAGAWAEDSNYSNTAAQRGAAKKWLYSELSGMDTKFRKYLHLRH